MSIKRTIECILLTLLCTAPLAAQTPIGTAFTYQGQLKNDGSPADGPHSMEFRLFPVLTGGTQVGPTLTFDGNSQSQVMVTNGLFTVRLDFGAAYNGDQRWLEITVNGTPLAPRQELTVAPYAARALSAPNGHALDAADGSPTDALFVDNAGNVGIGTATPVATLDVNGGIKTAGLQLTASPAANRVLTSDGAGMGTWQPVGLAGLSQQLQTQLLPLTSAELGGIGLAGSTATGDYPTSVAVSGGYAYVANSDSNTMHIFNVSNPASPALVGSAATGIRPRSVAVSGGYAYVVNLVSNTLQIFNVSNPASPTLAGSVATGSSPAFVAVSGSYAYVVNAGSDTLQIFNISNPASPTLAGSAVTGNSPVSVEISGGFAYVVNIDSDTLQIFNISNPASPTLAGSAETGRYPSSVAVVGGNAYVVNEGPNTLQIFNVSNPASPALAGSVATGSDPDSVAVSGLYAYVVNFYSNSLQIFNVSNPASPTLAHSAATGTNPWSVAVSGGYAYVVNSGSNTLQIFSATSSFQFPHGATFAGDVGIGTDTPEFPLSFSNALGDKIALWGQSGAHYGFGIQGGLMQIHGSASVDDIAFGYGSSAAFTERMRIRGNGNVGIGTTSPTAPLHVSASGNQAVRAVSASTVGTWLALQNSSTGGRNWNLISSGSANGEGPGKLLFNDQTAGATRMLIDTSGNVGIGTFTPSEKLQVAGNICATGTIGACSDARFKTQVEPVADALDIVEQLQGVMFDWRRDEFCDHQFAEGRQLGFIAQEVEKVVPQVVSTGSDGYKSVDYGRLTPVLVEAVKQIHDKVEDKEARIAALQNENAALKARLDRIESLIHKASN